MKRRSNAPESPEFKQRNTTGLSSYDLPGFNLADTPNRSQQPATAEQISAIHRTAQQILFMPIFSTTDRIFYGQTIDSLQAQEGFGTVRIALIDGVNFRLHLEENFNYGGCVLRLNMKKMDMRVYFESDEPDVDTSTAEWLGVSVLTPIRDELMVLSATGELEDDFLD